MPKSIVDVKIWTILACSWRQLPIPTCATSFSSVRRQGLKPPRPVCYCQHLSISNYSIKAQPVSSRRRRMISAIAAGKGQRYEWSAGRNVQFTGFWDFHLSSATQWRTGKREKGRARREDCSTSWTEYQQEHSIRTRVKAVCEQVQCCSQIWCFLIFLSLRWCRMCFFPSSSHQ